MTTLIHQGRNVKHVRETLKIKQETLAHKLNLSQSAVSQIESKEVIDEEMLEQISQSLGVSTDFIKNYQEKEALFNIWNENKDESKQNSQVVNYYSNCEVNPIDKMIELFDEKITGFKEKTELLEKLLASEKEKNQLLQQLLEAQSKK